MQLQEAFEGANATASGWETVNNVAFPVWVAVEGVVGGASQMA